MLWTPLLTLALWLSATLTNCVSAEGGLRRSLGSDIEHGSLSLSDLPIDAEVSALPDAEVSVLPDVAKVNNENDSNSDNSNNNNDSSNTFSSSAATTSTKIHEYLNELNLDWVRDSVVVLKWNSSGILENTTHPTNKQWFEEFVDSDFMHTTPSPHGKVALLFVNDCILFVPWNTAAPVPLLVYTMPREKLNTNNLVLFPNPYDESGFSQWQVDNLRNKLPNIEHTYDTFHERKNVLMWRGTDHGEKARKDLIELDKQEQARLLTVDESSSSATTRPWLDAKTSRNGVVSISEYDLASQYKYHLDVGGVSGTSWEGLRWKMCSGNLVFRVDSGNIDWWHGDIEPGVHYLQVNSDYSNIKEQYDWAETNPVDAYEMAKRGQQACLRSYTREYSQNTAKSMIKSLPDATVEQILEANVLLDEYYTKHNNSTH